MTGAEFEKRLREHFSIVGGSTAGVGVISTAEKEHAAAARSMSGFLILSQAFKRSFLEAIRLINKDEQQAASPQSTLNYRLFVLKLVPAFQRLCGAELAAIHGYPLVGFSVLRNIFDDMVLLSAVVQKLTDFRRIEGISDGALPGSKQMRAARKNEEFAVRSKMTGKHSGLCVETIQQLNKLDHLFDLEVHGARLSTSQSGEFLMGHSDLAVLPVFETNQFALFMNRFVEVGWLVHRLIPLMYVESTATSSSWVEGWKLLDESFNITVRALSQDLGKKIGDAYAEFVERKFPFGSESVFPL
jgi:hypothetical protein